MLYCTYHNISFIIFNRFIILVIFESRKLNLYQSDNKIKTLRFCLSLLMNILHEHE